MIAMTKMEQRLRDLCMNYSEYESKYHQYACQFNYKQEFLWDEYSDILAQIRIGNYYSVLVNGHEEFTEDTIYFE